MLYFIYSLVIAIYSALICAASLFNSKAALWCKGRIGQFKLLDARLKSWEGRKRFWIHAASYGEFEMSWPLIRCLKNKFPNAGFIVSFYSPSGYENIYLDEDDFIKIYLPADLKFLQKRYISLIKPSAFYFIKYEFWYNLMLALKAQNVPYFFVGTHINSGSYIFKQPFSAFKNLLGSADTIYAHSMQSQKIMTAQGLQNVQCFGDMRVQQARKNKDNLVEDIDWPDNSRPCIIYGSVTEFELPYILKMIRKMKGCNHLLAPHDVEEIFFEMIREAGIEYSRISKSHISICNLMVIDNYGSLKYFYEKADIAYIGGGFQKGPHNIVEALVFGIPVIIGKNTRKYPLARMGVDRGFVHIAETPDDIMVKAKELLGKDTNYRQANIDEFLDELVARMDLVEADLTGL